MHLNLAQALLLVEILFGLVSTGNASQWLDGSSVTLQSYWQTSPKINSCAQYTD